ncbi:MAG: CARDB domain-containing protein, partial [Candidatus Korobacteraceae bacterium]
ILDYAIGPGGELYYVSSGGSVNEEHQEPRNPELRKIVFDSELVKPDLRTSISFGASRFSVGESIQITLQITNQGVRAAAGSQLTLTSNLASSVLASKPSQGTCATGGDGLLQCAIGELLAGSSATVEARIRHSGAGQVTYTARVTSLSEDGDLIEDYESMQAAVEVTDFRILLPARLELRRVVKAEVIVLIEPVAGAYDYPVSLTCSAAGFRCSVSPSQVTIGGTKVNATVLLEPSSSASTAGFSSFAVLWLPLAAVLIGGWKGLRKGSAIAVLILFLLVGASSCGSPLEFIDVTVRGTSPHVEYSVNVTAEIF